MTDEIKEILEALKPHNEVKEYPLILSLEQQKTLLNYITNLQQLYENSLKVNQNSHKYITELEMNNAILKEDLEKANDIIEKDRQFNAGRLLDIANLKKENEKLKEELKNRPIVDFTFDVYKELKDYKSRFEKTIEYINFVINHYKEQLETPIEDTYFDSDVNRKGYILSIIAYLQTILDTLIGSDENE